MNPLQNANITRISPEEKKPDTLFEVISEEQLLNPCDILGKIHFG